MNYDHKACKLIETGARSSFIGIKIYFFFDLRIIIYVVLKRRLHTKKSTS